MMRAEVTHTEASAKQGWDCICCFGMLPQLLSQACIADFAGRPGSWHAPCSSQTCGCAPLLQVCWKARTLIFVTLCVRAAPAGMLGGWDAPFSLPALFPRPFIIVNGALDPRCPMQGAHNESSLPMDPRCPMQGAHNESSLPMDPRCPMQGAHNESSLPMDSRCPMQGAHNESSVAMDPRSLICKVRAKSCARNRSVQLTELKTPEAPSLESRARTVDMCAPGKHSSPVLHTSVPPTCALTCTAHWSEEKRVFGYVCMV